MTTKEITKAEVSLQSPKALMKFAGELKNFIVKQKLFTPIQGKNYVNVEGWQFAGGNLGLLPVVEKCERLNRPSEIIYQASVALYAGERIVSRGIAVCSSKEKGKNAKDEYVIASMAQTRAEGKAYRLILGWLMKVAGYEATPSEEVSATGKEEKPKEAVVAKTEKSGVNYVDQVKKFLYKKGAKAEWPALELLCKLTGKQYDKFSQITQVQAKFLIGKLLIAKK